MTSTDAINQDQFPTSNKKLKTNKIARHWTEIAFLQSVIGYIFLVTCLIGDIYYLNTHVFDYLIGDASSELVLSDFLSKNSEIISEEFYYSTGIRILYQQLVFAPLLALFPNDWHLARVVGTSILYLMMIGCLYFFCSSSKLKRVFPWIASAILLPINQAYAIYVLYLTYYFFFLFVALIIVGTVNRLVSSSPPSRTQTIILFAIGILLSLIEGIEGVRLIVDVIIPIAIAFPTTVFMFHLPWKKAKLASFFCISIALFAFIGMILHSTVIAHNYSFANFGNAIEWTPFNIDRAIEVINGFISLFGFDPQAKLSSLRSLSNLLSLLGFLVFLVAIVNILNPKKKYPLHARFLAVFICCSMAILIIIYSFTNMQYKTRYLLTNFIFIVPIFAIYLKSFNFSALIKPIIYSILAMCLIIMAIAGCRSAENTAGVYRSQNQQLLNIVEAMEADGYRAGYSTFLYGNVISELSNGQIEMWIFRGYVAADGRQQMNDIDDIYEWLQSKSHSKTKPENAFVLFSRQEISEQSYAQTMQNEMPIYETQDFVVFDASALKRARH